MALVRLGRDERIWPLLKHSADPQLRSLIVNWLNPLGPDPGRLVGEFDRIPATVKPTPAQGQSFMDAVLFHPETSIRRALILALGAYGKDGLSKGERSLSSSSCSISTVMTPTPESTGRRSGRSVSGRTRRSNRGDEATTRATDAGS